MTDSLQTHAIAPAVVLRGGGAWLEALPRIGALGQHPFLLGRSAATYGLRQQLFVDLEQAGVRPVASQPFRDCCDEDLVPLAQHARAAGCYALIAAGGGKVLDAGKLLAHRLGLPCITVPTSAATCAGWTALANVYTPEGAFLGDASIGVAYRRGALQGSVGVIYREIEANGIKAYGGINTDVSEGLVAFQLTIRPRE